MKNDSVERRMDKFDAMINEYLRSHHKTIDYLCEKIGSNPSSLWRYRTKVKSFINMPQDILANCFLITNASNETIRYILGLPTGQRNEN